MAALIREHFKHDKCRTTRSSSNLLDACGIDLIGTDALYQCKSGYAKRRPRYEEEYEYIKQNIAKHFGETHKINSYPIFLLTEIDVGKGNKREKQHTQITMSLEDFLNIYKGIKPDIIDIL